VVDWRRGCAKVEKGGRHRWPTLLKGATARIREVRPPTRGPGHSARFLTSSNRVKSIQHVSNLFQIISNLIHSKRSFVKLKKSEIKYDFKVFMKGTTFSIGTSPYSKWILNQNLGKTMSVFDFKNLIKIAINGL
jgi:hypothetical protein